MTDMDTEAAERQVVVLHLGDDVFGIDIAVIHTVITPQAIIRRLPNRARALEVLRLPEGSIDPPSGLVASTDRACILGIGRIPGGRADAANADRLILLLDISRTLVTTPEAADALHGLHHAA